MFLRRLLNPSTTTPSPSPHLLIFKSHFGNSFINTKKPKKLRKRKKPESARFKLVQSEPNIIPHFESILKRDTHFRFLIKSKHFIAKLPQQTLPLDHAPRFYNSLGLPRGRNIKKFVGNHPLLYEFHRHDHDKIWVGFSSLMKELLEEENGIFDEMEVERVNVVRKLLMMSKDKRIELSKICHNWLLFGIGENFRERVGKYSDFFRVVVDRDGTEVIELVKWDPLLAVSALEREFFRDEEKVKWVFKWPRDGEKLDLGIALDEDEEEEGEEEEEEMLNALPLVSPYSDGRKFDVWSLEAEKFRLGLIHEFLSLTLEKRALIHNIVEFEEFGLTKTNFEMLKRQPQTFYLAGTEMNWSVFLKDAYGEDGCLIHKDPLVLFYEKLFKYAEKKESVPVVKVVLESDKVVSE